MKDSVIAKTLTPREMKEIRCQTQTFICFGMIKV